MKVKVTQRTADKITSLYRRDVEPKVIADTLGMPLKKVNAIISGDYTTSIPTTKDVREFHELYAQGLTAHQISIRTGWSSPVVVKYLKDVRPVVPKKNVSEEEIKRIRRMYLDGIPQSVIAKETGWRNNVIYYHIRDLAKKAGHTRLTNRQKEEIQDMYREGTKVSDLAEKFNVHVSTIYRIIRK